MSIAVRAGSFASVVALLVYLAATVWLGELERGGPLHFDVVLDGEIPGTLHLPAASASLVPNRSRAPATASQWDREPPPREERPPAVVLVHGFSADRAGMSILARSLATSGYAALAIDVRGHGQNRNPFTEGRGRPDFLADDIEAAVEFLRTSPYVDGRRIALLGHSMGASAVLEYGSRDTALDGLVLISGGRRYTGPHRPPNALFVTATRDPERIRVRARELASRLAGSPLAETGRIQGDFAHFTASSHVEVSGADHVTVLGSSAAILQIVAWLDRIYGESRSGHILRTDARLEVAALCGVAFVFLLPALGALLGRLAPVSDPAPSRALAGLAVWALACVGAIPLVAAGSPLPLLSVEVGDVVVPQLFVAGCVVLLVLHGTGALPDAIGFSGAQGWRRSTLAAAVGLVAVAFVMTPLGVVFHRLTLTPERALVAALLTLCLFPPALAAGLLLRRGGALQAACFSLLGKVVTLAAVWLGVLAGVTPGVVLLMLPLLAIVFILVELVAGGLYAASNNRVAAAMFEAAWLGWLFAAVLPVRL